MITVDDSGRQLTVHFGGGTISVCGGAARDTSVTVGLVRFEQLTTRGEPGKPVPSGVKADGSTIVLAFHNLVGLAVVEKAIAKARRHLEQAGIATPGPVEESVIAGGQP